MSSFTEVEPHCKFTPPFIHLSQPLLYLISFDSTFTLFPDVDSISSRHSLTAAAAAMICKENNSITLFQFVAKYKNQNQFAPVFMILEAATWGGSMIGPILGGKIELL